MNRTSLLIVFALAGCAAPQPVAPIGPIDMPQLDSALSEPCARPVKIPQQINSSGVDPLWAQDREEKATCADKYAALLATISANRKALSGK